MPTAYSTDLRKRVLDAYQAKEGSQRQLAESFKVSLSFVRDLMRRYRQTGSVEPLPRRGRCGATIDSSLLVVVEQLIQVQPDALLTELCERFSERTTITVSISTMHRAVH
jgi:transposase